MFCNPNGASDLRPRNRSIKSGLFTQSNLMPEKQAGSNSIRILPKGGDLLQRGGISE